MVQVAQVAACKWHSASRVKVLIPHWVEGAAVLAILRGLSDHDRGKESILTSVWTYTPGDTTPQSTINTYTYFVCHLCSNFWYLSSWFHAVLPHLTCYAFKLFW